MTPSWLPPSPEQRRRFLHVLAHTGSRALACGAANVTLRQITAVRDADPAFELEWRIAERRVRSRFFEIPE